MNLDSHVPLMLTIMGALLAVSTSSTLSGPTAPSTLEYSRRKISANQRLSTPDDPAGLKIVGLGKPLIKYPLVRPDTPVPDLFQDCGEGVIYTTLSNKKVKETKVVIVTFKPKTEEVYVPGAEELKHAKLVKTEDVIYVPPVGYGSLSFQWPAELRALRPVRLQWTGFDKAGPTAQTQELGAELNVSEGESPTLEWRLDNNVSGERLGPVLFYITLPKGAKRCIGK